MSKSIERGVAIALLIIGLISFEATAKSHSARETFDNFYIKAREFSNNYPRENTYLHFDNMSYYTGDTIQYKAYMFLSNSDTLSSVSIPLYVEMLDHNGIIVDKQILKIADNSASGRFILDNKLLPGYYEIRAYTKWMSGFNEPQYFSRTFPIYKPEVNNSKRTITEYVPEENSGKRGSVNKNDLNLMFFPEGGNLVEGINSRIAFKAESRNGKKLNIKGIILDYAGIEICKFSSTHDGMGFFDYKPTGKPAFAKVNFEGESYQFTLPAALQSGYVIRLDNNTESIKATVCCSANKSNDSIALFVSNKGVPFEYKTFDFRNDREFIHNLSTKDTPDGLLQFTVMNKRGQILAERFAFSYPKMPVEISVSEGLHIYPPYSHASYTIQAFDTPEHPVKGTMSVSVTDAVHSDYRNFDNTIFTDRLLTSELKGYIHNPGYYFTDMSTRKVNELDLLIMVHGWRKYDMTCQVGAAPFSLLYNAEKQLTVNGMVRYNNSEKKRLSDIRLSVFMHQEDNKMKAEGFTEADGSFSIAVSDFYSNAGGTFKADKSMKNRTNDICINMDRNYAPQPRPYYPEEYNPEWVSNSKLFTSSLLFDAGFTDSIVRNDTYNMIKGLDSKEKNFNRNIITKTSTNGDVFDIVTAPVTYKEDDYSPVFINCIQQTIIQGYEKAYEHYTPSYNVNKPLDFTRKDKRRTLFWDPALKTDNEGKAVIEFFNNQFSTPVTIRVEMVSENGHVASYTYSSMRR